MAMTDKRKQSLYFPDDMLREIQAEADRQDRSLSWIVQRAWQIARERIALLPASPTTAPAPKVELPDPYLAELRRAAGGEG